MQRYKTIFADIHLTLLFVVYPATAAVGQDRSTDRDVAPPDLKRNLIGRPSAIANEEDLSDLSDGEGYFYPGDEKSKASVELLSLSKTEMKAIKELYSMGNKVSSSVIFNNAIMRWTAWGSRAIIAVCSELGFCSPWYLNYVKNMIQFNCCKRCIIQFAC